MFSSSVTIIWDRCKRSPSYSDEKITLLNWIEEYFDGLAEELIIDPEDDEFKEDSGMYNSRFFATAFFRKLKATGWIEERDGGYEEECQC